MGPFGAQKPPKFWFVDQLWPFVCQNDSLVDWDFGPIGANMTPPPTLSFFLSKGRRKNQSVFLVYSIEEQGLPKCTIEKIYIKQQVLPPLLWSPRAVKIVPRRCRASQILRLSYVHTRHILTYQPPSRCRKPRWCSPPKSSSPSFQLSPR